MNDTINNPLPAEFVYDSDHATLFCRGDWVLSNLAEIEKKLDKINWPLDATVTVSGKDISHLDSAGAWLLYRLKASLLSSSDDIKFVDFSAKQQAVLTIAEKQADEIETKSPTKVKDTILVWFGKESVLRFERATAFLSYVGEIAEIIVKLIKTPLRCQWQSLAHVVEDAGFNALPILALLSFLIGVVLAYQLGLQLQTYGANIYIVNLSGMAILREFGPLITAIIVAGRSGSAFTAHIGLMKVNEEIDALQTMGLSPNNRLAIPRVFAAILVVPLLTVWSDAFGVIGSMFMSENMLGISMYDFISRFDDVIKPATFWTGIAKAPVFGMMVAIVGCFQGFNVSYTAESIGRQTTVSVVQALFLIIITDAIFSVLYSMVGI